MVDQVKNFDELPAALSVWPDLGKALGISRATAYKLIREPGFPAIRVSKKKIIVPKNRLLDYLGKLADAGLDHFMGNDNDGSVINGSF